MQDEAKDKSSNDYFSYSLTEYHDVNLDQRHKRISVGCNWRPTGYDEYPEF